VVSKKAFPPQAGRRGFLLDRHRGENMGRTVRPFSHMLEKEHRRWKEFRKGLSREDQDAFDRLFDRAKFHTAAAVYMARPWPLETILLSVCLEHEKMISEI
jgi:hypothetical protein